MMKCFLILLVLLQLTACRQAAETANPAPNASSHPSALGTEETPQATPAASGDQRATARWFKDKAHGGAAARQFAYAGLEHEEVRGFWTRLQTAVHADNRSAVAQLVRYPFRVEIRQGSGPVVLNGPGQFVQKYSSIMTARVRDVISSTEVSELQANWQGVKAGPGVLWFGGVCEEPGKCARYEIRINHISPHPIQ